MYHVYRFVSYSFYRIWYNLPGEEDRCGSPWVASSNMHFDNMYVYIYIYMIMFFRTECWCQRKTKIPSRLRKPQIYNVRVHRESINTSRVSLNKVHKQQCTNRCSPTLVHEQTSLLTSRASQDSYIYIYICTQMFVHMCIYIYIDRYRYSSRDVSVHKLPFTNKVVYLPNTV